MTPIEILISGCCRLQRATLSSAAFEGRSGDLLTEFVARPQAPRSSCRVRSHVTSNSPHCPPTPPSYARHRPEAGGDFQKGGGPAGERGGRSGGAAANTPAVARRRWMRDRTIWTTAVEVASTRLSPEHRECCQEAVRIDTDRCQSVLREIRDLPANLFRDRVAEAEPPNNGIPRIILRNSVQG